MTGTARREEGAPVAATFADPRLIVLGENKMVGHAIHGMIALGGRSRRGSRVTPTPDSTLADAQQTIADLRRELEECSAERNKAQTERDDALQRETATGEVLQVINSSPGDLAPVFEAILEKAHSLCDVAYGSLELYDGQNFRSVAERGLPKAFADMLRQGYPASDNPATRPLIEGSRVTHIADLAETDYAIPQSAVDLVSARTLLCVPLRRDSVLLGMSACARQEVRPFTEKEIALLENFAVQFPSLLDRLRLSHPRFTSALPISLTE